MIPIFTLTRPTPGTFLQKQGCNASTYPPTRYSECDVHLLAQIQQVNAKACSQDTVERVLDRDSSGNNVRVGNHLEDTAVDLYNAKHISTALVHTYLNLVDALAVSVYEAVEGSVNGIKPGDKGAGVTCSFEVRKVL